ncbi:MAG: nucleoside triphosphate pyrophosphohydrolase [Chloroflexi bacterium RBG_16_51_9]|nr:MAG: nucleoside triphosphate pyrophosphohydrolase [Chloroflexi bacterium RBG_16_51_9]
MSVPKNLDKFETLVKIIARLRAPDGCPWDREQTHASLREFLLEESYEVLAALDEGNSEKLCQELGDLLLQIVLHTQIAAEAGEFKLEDVMRGINTKLIRRHPHVFGSEKVKDAAEVAHNWETIKQEERGADASLLASVPGQMPALSYSQAIQRRVAEVGFDWPDIDGVIDKLAEEVGEFKQSSTGEQKAEEFGDLLFTLVNFARRQGIDSESALREANQKFYRRFSYMEDLCRQRGLTFARLSFVQQNALWEEAKKDKDKVFRGDNV